MSLVKEKAGAITFGLVGFLFLVELVSGILQGFYVPLIPDLVDHLGIKDADFNWFEAAQLLLSAIVVPILAKCGDMFGHKRILLIATVLTAGSTWALAFTNTFTTFLIAWALQGFYVVWLPLEVALIFDRGRVTGRGASQTRRAAGYLVVALEAGAIIGALARLVMPGKQSIGVLMTILLGVVGAFLGSWVTAQFGYHNANGGFAILPFVVGVAAAAALIALYVAISGRRGTTVHR